MSENAWTRMLRPSGNPGGADIAAVRKSRRYSHQDRSSGEESRTMERSDPKYQTYVQILREELVPAMGCTEPIALSYAAAYARDVLGGMPDRVEVEASGSIIKNVKSVIVPNTDHLKGIPAAVAAGIAAGDAARKLEVIAGVTKEQILEIKAFMADVPIQVKLMEPARTFDIRVTLHKGGSCASVRISDFHTNIVRVEKDGKVLLEKADADQNQSSSLDRNHCQETGQTVKADRTLLCMEDIWDFCNTVDLADVKDILDRQIRCNMAIAEEGLRNGYGANIGKVILASETNGTRTLAKAMAASGSDARMNGCELPVIINSGSGNQGITASVPVIVYARELKVPEEKMYRALVLSNLTAVHQKTPIGTLSAYCGAVSAGAGAGVGIAFLCGGGYEEVIHTLVNAVAIISGMICDGAKASCAAKIAMSVDAGILGYEMYRKGQQFYGGDGIVSKGVEATLENVGRLGKDGMKETNEEIIRIMCGDR